MKTPTGKTMHEMRLMYYQRQGGLCWLCDEHVDLFRPVHTYGGASWEHVIPRCHGGSKGWHNVVLTHCECNKARGERLIWRLTRPKPGVSFKRPDAAKEQRRFEHQVVNRLRPLFELARAT